MGPRCRGTLTLTLTLALSTLPPDPSPGHKYTPKPNPNSNPNPSPSRSPSRSPSPKPKPKPKPNPNPNPNLNPNPNPNPNLTRWFALGAGRLAFPRTGRGVRAVQPAGVGIRDALRLRAAAVASVAPAAAFQVVGRHRVQALLGNEPAARRPLAKPDARKHGALSAAGCLWQASQAYFQAAQARVAAAGAPAHTPARQHRPSQRGRVVHRGRAAVEGRVCAGPARAAPVGARARGRSPSW